MSSENIVLTRRIQLLIDSDDELLIKEAKEKLYNWQRVCFRAANQIMTHQFVQEQVKDFFYFTDVLNLNFIIVIKTEIHNDQIRIENQTISLVSMFILFSFYIYYALKQLMNIRNFFLPKILENSKVLKVLFYKTDRTAGRVPLIRIEFSSIENSVFIEKSPFSEHQRF